MRRLTYLSIVMTTLLLPPPSGADVCQSLGSRPQFGSDSVIENDYFDRYNIENIHGSYYIGATRTETLDLAVLIAVFDDFANWSDISPAYKSIEVRPLTTTLLLTGIRFRPSFSPFTSKFTNRIEVSNEEHIYRQCWRQLDEADEDVIEPYQNEPLENRGSWQVQRIDSQRVRIDYYSVIKPPIPLPAWLYRFVVRNSYVDTFERIIAKANEIQRGPRATKP